MFSGRGDVETRCGRPNRQGPVHRLGCAPALKIQGPTCSEGHCNSPNSGEGCEEVGLGAGERRAGSWSVPLWISLRNIGRIGRRLPRRAARRGRWSAGRHVSISFARGQKAGTIEEGTA